MILRVLDNTTMNRKQHSIQKITANYDPSNSVTTICFDADVVTLGIVASFLNAEYQRKKEAVPDDLLEQLDNTINKTLYEYRREGGN